MKHQVQNQVGEKPVYLAYTCTAVCVDSISEGSRDKDSKGQEPDAEAMKRCCLLACPVCFLIEPGPPTQAWPHPQWAEPSLVNHYLRKCIIARYYGDIFSTKIASFQITLVCVSSWHKPSQHNWSFGNLIYKYITIKPYLFLLIHPQDLALKTQVTLKVPQFLTNSNRSKFQPLYNIQSL